MFVGGGRICVFCEQSNINEDLHGKLLSNRDMAAHYFCMVGTNISNSTKIADNKTICIPVRALT